MMQLFKKGNTVKLTKACYEFLETDIIQIKYKRLSHPKELRGRILSSVEEKYHNKLVSYFYEVAWLNEDGEEDELLRREWGADDWHQDNLEPCFILIELKSMFLILV